MKLSDLDNIKDFLIKDGTFEVLAKTNCDTDKKILSYLDDIRFLDEVTKNKSITSLICKEEHIKHLEKYDYGLIVVKNPRDFFFLLHNSLVKQAEINKKKVKTIIGKNCMISKSARIAENNVTIGEGVVIEEFVVIKENVKIGDNTIIRSGSIIGGEGFELKRIEEDIVLKVLHSGKTIIGNNIEIKEYCTIHKALFEWDYTLIDDFSMLDAHVHIGHGTKIKKRVFLGSGANIAGNVTINQDSYVGPNTTISNRIKIGCNVKISLGSVVTKNVKNEEHVTGNFAINHDQFIANLKKSITKSCNEEI